MVFLLWVEGQRVIQICGVEWEDNDKTLQLSADLVVRERRDRDVW